VLSASAPLALGPSFLDPDHLIEAFGLLGILVIVFAESGLLIGFFLPGDSLLFTAGLLVANGEYISSPIWLVCGLITIAAILGDQVGYLFGRKVGPALFRRPDSRFFKQENVEKAHQFFEKYGARSIVLARFVPIVRTFTPIIAGVCQMNYRVFVLFNIIGGVLWGTGVTLLGYFLGQIQFIREHIELILILIVVISVVPIGIELLRSQLAARKQATTTAPSSPSPAPAGSAAPGHTMPTPAISDFTVPIPTETDSEEATVAMPNPATAGSTSIADSEQATITMPAVSSQGVPPPPASPTRPLPPTVNGPHQYPTGQYPNR